MDHTQQLSEKNISKLLFEFSLPAIVGMLVNSLYNVIDRAFIGNSVGTLGLAGVTISFPVMLIIVAFVLLIGIGASALVSIKLGEGDRDQAERIVGNAFLLLTIVSLAITFFGLIFLKPVLKLFGASREVLPYAEAYLQVILGGTLFQSIGFGMNNFIRGEGNPRTAMFTMLLGAALNVVFCPIFIFGLGMGIRGSALATVLAQGISGLWVLHYFISGKSSLKIRRKNLKLDQAIVGKIIALGSAQFVMELATSLVNLILNRSLIRYGGDLAISGMGIVTSLQTLVLMPLFGINQGVQPIIGFNYGAQKYDRVKQALKLAVLGASIIAIAGFVIVEAFPEQLVGVFNRDDARLRDFTVYAMRVFLMMLPLIGFQVIGSNYFMAVGRPTPAALLSLSRQFILLIPAVLILPHFFKLHGVIMAGPVADFGASLITAAWLYQELRRLHVMSGKMPAITAMKQGETHG
ncbi:putative MATE family efflux protein [Hydrogenispora ethanolica]|jgi:putative MATE family efflux protein|uniref:Multidrug export protein MepA n=1 Tax=Hydrogenispora ethanolica TaxID=1082276 RepID=A0A4V2QFL5_HYDET|nr:MATE family efflux transporter [Hydrogenispora ethanolica]TCL72397.1 putative MATE family efflux protein [Hydrogenispora ethanolica]